MDKKSLSEQEIRTRYITPAIQQAGWQPQQIREEVSFTAGKINVQKHLVVRGKRRRADYLLFYQPNLPLAVVEAKDNTHSIGSGMQQALRYAESLDLPFVYSSNGDGFLEHDRTVASGVVEQELPLDQFPSPSQLWGRYTQSRDISPESERIVTQPYHVERGGKIPRYFQRVAINRAVEAIANGENRILLVMATGTGKTYTAFQIIWRLWRARIKKRILFLADRNILIDQARVKDFKYFGDVMTKISNRQINKSYEVYLTLYQAVSGSEEVQNIYKQFSPEFFDLVVVDECHRGSAAADSAWREILEYFSSATQIGLTATPKETREISNIDYFGEPLYTYSLKQGIEDGFLAPYKVIRINLDKDLDGWSPDAGQQDKYGYAIPEREYNVLDYDRTLVIDERTNRVAQRISDYLKQTDRYAKTIIFCRDIDHAERMRQTLQNQNTDLVHENAKYVMRITGDEEEGKRELDNFINPEERYPVIVTTSKLLTTGVDAETCKLIVLDTIINSMTEFKQIIGRGTRIREDFGKMFFTIMDFRHATRLFYDPQFDGEPVQIYEPQPGDPIVPPEELEFVYDDEPEDENDTQQQVPRKFYVNGVNVSIVAERVQYYGRDGRLVTESFVEFSRKNLRNVYTSLNDFLNKWHEVDRKEVILAELLDHGILLEQLQEAVGKELDPFDLICHVAFDKPPLTRRERMKQVKKQDYFTRYSEAVQQVLGVLLDKYADEGIEAVERALEDTQIVPLLKTASFNTIGSPVQIIKAFGGKEKYLEVVKELEMQIYEVA